MKFRSAFFFFLLLCVLFSAWRPPLTLTQFISGKITWTGMQPGIRFEDMTVFVTVDGRLSGSSLVDSAQRYSLMVNSGRPTNRYNFFITSLGDTLCLASYPSLGNADELTYDFVLPKKYEMMNRKAVCPQCGKVDKTLKIVYGDGVPAQKGKVIPGGCIISPISPNWRCERDGVNY